jgi:predicted component of type VI protein secretion system
LEGSISARAGQLVELDGLPRTGVARLSWNEEQLLRAGEVRVLELELRLPSGLLLRLGDNAELDQTSILLNDAGTGLVGVFVHLVGWTTVETAPTEQGDLPVTRKVARLKLATTESLDPPSAESLRLAEFVKTGNEQWLCSPSFIPPLLSVMGTPFLEQPLKDLEEPLEVLRGKLVQQLSFQWLEGTSLAGVKSSLQQVYALQGLLADMREGTDQHPYLLFRQLRGLFFEFFFFQTPSRRVDPEWARRPYVHESPAGCIVGLVEAIRTICSQEWPLPSFARFKADNAAMVLQLPDDLSGNEDFYLWLRKPRREMEIDTSTIKLAARSRLDRLHKLSLNGIGLERAALPAFARQLDPNVELFRFRDDEERSYALREGVLAYYPRQGQDQMEAALSWGASLAVGGLV